MFEFGVVVEIYSWAAGVSHTGNDAGWQTIGGGVRSVEGGVIGFCALPVLDLSCPSGGDFVVALVVGG
jgi:hypothetical protein